MSKNRAHEFTNHNWREFPDVFERISKKTPFIAKAIKTNSSGLKASVYIFKDGDSLEKFWVRESSIPSYENSIKMYRYEKSIIWDELK